MSLAVRILALLAMVCPLRLSTHAEPVVVRLDFNADKDPASGWQATPGALVSDFGRSGRCLSISSYGEERALGKRPVGHNNASWTGPAYKVSPDEMKSLEVSAWGYAMFSYGQDASYAGLLSVEFLDSEGKPIRRAQACRWTRDTNLAIHERTRVLPWGIRWTYREKSVGVPAGTKSARLIFHFLKDPGGIVWVDDILVTAGGSALDRSEAVSGGGEPVQAGEQRRAVPPFEGWLSTPAYANFFLDDEPLLFLFWVRDPDDRKAEVEVPGDAVVRYRIADFDHLHVASGEAPVSPAPPTKPSISPTALRFRLPDSLREHRGRYLVCEAELFKGPEVLSAAATSFCVLSPGKRGWSKKEVLDGHFGQGWKGMELAGSVEGMSPRRKGLQSLAHLFGARLTFAYDFGGWKQHQPKPGPFVKTERFDRLKGTDQAFNYGFYYHWSPERQHEWMPKWALQDAEKFPYRFRKEDWLNYVRRVAERFKGHPVVYTPTGTERAETNFMYECHRDAAKVIREVDPDALICLETVGLGEEGFRRTKELGVAVDTDIYDMHLYSIRNFDPRDFSVLKEKLAGLRGGRPVKVWSTELAYTGAFTQVSKAARLWDTHMAMFAAGFDGICWFTLQASGVRDAAPVLREWPRFIGAWSHYFLLCRYANGDVSPQLAAVAYANIIDALEGYRSLERIACDAETHVVAFHHENSTVIGLWREPMRKEREVWLEGLGGASARLLDIFGREHRLHAENGRLLLTVMESPLLLLLDRKATGISCRPAAQVLFDDPGTTHEIAHGSSWRIAVSRRADPDLRASKVRAEVGPGFECRTRKRRKEVAVTVQSPGDGAEFDGPSFPVWIQCENRHGQAFGLLQRRVSFVQAVRIRIASEYVSGREGALNLEIRNTKDSPLRPNITVEADGVSASVRPTRPQRTLELAPGQEAQWRVPLDLPPNWWHDFPVRVRWVTEGFSGTAERSVHFRPSTFASGPMEMDGGLSDWADAAWVPAIHMSYMLGGNHNIRWRPWEEEWTGPDDARMFLASKWDEERLYFAARIIDDKFFHEAPDAEKLKFGDSIHFCFYAGGIGPGDFPRIRIYKDWIAGLTSGKGALFRKTGPFEPSHGVLPGVEIGAQLTDKGGVLEWSYPRSCVRPLELRAGQEFRVCACYQDYDQPLPWVEKMLDPFMSGAHGGYATKMRYIHIGQRFIGINHDALLFAPFQMVGGE